MDETPSQTAGPYLHIGLAPGAAGLDRFAPPLGADPAGRAEGPRIRIGGTIRDGAGDPVRDALVETWQPDTRGRWADASRNDGFTGWGRTVTDFETGAWTIETVKPGAAGDQAPHVALWIAARGINLALHTRLYFPDEDNAGDPVLAAIPEARRPTLIAAAEPGGYRLDIRLQGEGETVFLDV